MQTFAQVNTGSDLDPKKRPRHGVSGEAVGNQGGAVSGFGQKVLPGSYLAGT
jgi:hypothetical protein